MAGVQPTRGRLRRDLRYAQAAEAAYRRPAEAREVFAALGYGRLEEVVHAGTDTQVYVAANEAEILIVPRGTQRNYKDILTDLKVRPAELRGRLDGATVHRGFLEAWLSVEQRVHDAVCELAHDAVCELAPAGRLADDCQVVACGHSLGGALAVLATVRIRSVREIVSFGAPRVGDIAFRENMRRLRQRTGLTHRRWVRGADVVPIVPLLAMGYRHDVAPCYVDDAGKLTVHASLPRELSGRARALLTVDWSEGWAGLPVPTRMFTDHRVAGYVDDLQRLAGRVRGNGVDALATRSQALHNMTGGRSR